jgi:hypothetical protein
LIITLVFEKNANFFAENCRKSQKIVIITSTPGQSGDNFPNFSNFWCPFDCLKLGLNFRWLCLENFGHFSEAFPVTLFARYPVFFLSLLFLQQEKNCCFHVKLLRSSTNVCKTKNRCDQTSLWKNAQNGA